MYTDPIAALVRAYAFRFCADPELLQRACVDHTCRPAFGDDEDDDEESEQTGIEPTKVLIERLLGFALPAKAVSKPTVLSEFLHQQAQACEMPELNETVVGRNLQRVAQALGLDDIERDVVLITSLSRYQSDLGQLFNTLGKLSNQRLAALFATLTGHSAEAIYTRIKQRSPLLEMCLLMVSMPQKHFTGKVRLIERLHWRVAEEDQTVEGIFDCYVRRADPPSLTLEDFAGYPEDVSLLLPYLKAVTRQRRQGCNVLVYGRPGTGKTELVRAMAQHLDLALWEMPSAEDSDDGGPQFAARAVRTSGYAMAQRLLARHAQALLLFDECEENIPGPIELKHRSSHASQGKLWFNRLLENNPVPALWVCNNIDFVDPAFIRRFDLVLHLDSVPPATRQRIIQRAVEPLGVDEKWIQRIAHNSDVTPAHIQRATRVAQLCESHAQQAQHIIEQQLRSTLVAAGIHKSFAHQPEPDFNLDYSHADHDVGALASALGRARFGRLCFYGPPGTGKTAYARHLARHLGMPLLEKKASDLLDAFVGQTEQNLAAAFLQAHKENAILLIDEADSFLMDRNQAQMRWEVSQTNELLCQMEAYNGLFIATTNRFDELDSAALRRFDIKVRFRCLIPQQVWLCFCHFLQQTAEELTAYRNRVLALEDVTPGLFAIATRRQALYGQALHAQALFDLLQAESAHQRGWGERRPIGFTHG